MSGSSAKNDEPDNWGSPVTLTPEQIIEWLESHRAFMIEIWEKNPGTRAAWERINQTSGGTSAASAGPVSRGPSR